MLAADVGSDLLVPVWATAPQGGTYPAGTPLCPSGGGCLISAADDFGNTVFAPVVVELGTVAGDVRVSGPPQYILVTGGVSDPLAMSLAIDSTPNALVGSGATAVTGSLGIRFATGREGRGPARWR